MSLRLQQDQAFGEYSLCSIVYLGIELGIYKIWFFIELVKNNMNLNLSYMLKRLNGQISNVYYKQNLKHDVYGGKEKNQIDGYSCIQIIVAFIGR